MRLLFSLCLILIGITTCAQHSDDYLSLVLSDVMREAKIPGAACAFITSEKIEYGTFGVTSVGGNQKITSQSHFHIGSCTKSITGFVAAQAVKEGAITWDTKFFNLFPDLKASSRDAYDDITFGDLLSHCAWLRAFTDDKEFKKVPDYDDDDLEARLKFAKLVLSLKPVKPKASYEYSNAGYVLAALMIEKATSKTWEEYVQKYFAEQGWEYKLGYASYTDDTQPWGHYRKKRSGEMVRISQGQDFDLWPYVAPAGDISMRVVDYAAYLQQHLLGLQKGDEYFTAEEYRNMHYRNEVYALGWGHGKANGTFEISTHTGSAGAFLAMMIVAPSKDLAILVVTNSGDDEESNDAAKAVRNRILREKLSADD